MNIFEGARRLSYMVGMVATIGVLFFAVTYDPYVSIYYSISHPQAEFQRIEGSCPPDAGRHFFSTQDDSEASVSINLCLLAMEFDNGKQLIPYKIDKDGVVWGDEKYSNNVTTYEKELEARFTIPIEDNVWIKDKRSSLYWSHWKDGLVGLVIGLIIFSLFVWGVGWIVRGFLGIPRGMDKRPNKDI